MTYQDTQLPLLGPIKVVFTDGLALTNTSPWRTFPLIWVANAEDPAEKPVKVYPVAALKAGPISFSITLTSDPA